jgi:hypothetical protein
MIVWILIAAAGFTIVPCVVVAAVLAELGRNVSELVRSEAP